MSQLKTNSYQIKSLIAIAVFAALSYAVTFVFRIPVAFLTFDAKDAVITVAAFIYGPISALAMALISSLIEWFTISGTGFYGFLMNFLGSAVFAFAASFIYRFKRTLGGALISLFGAVVFMTGAMMLLNLWITPLYTGTDVATVRGMIPTLLFPFNLAKALLNAALVLVLYKPVSTALVRAGFLKKKETATFTFNRSTAIMLGTAVVLALAATLIFLSLKGII